MGGSDGEEIALVTGASSGIGEALARRLARDGRALGLVARRVDRLEALARELRDGHHVAVHVLPADLTQPGAVARLVEELGARGLVVDWLVNNAGFGTAGRFDTLPVERELEQVTLNVEALVELTGRLLPGMVRRRRGVVMNVSSIGGFIPSPYMATYTGTKAFVLSFSEAIAAELAGTGVHVLCVCPGATRTEFQDTAGVDLPAPDFAWQTADEVADEAVRAVGRGSVVVNGVLNKLTIATAKLVPHALLTRITGRMFRPKEV
jgi:short-subunit dehydrogenase